MGSSGSDGGSHEPWWCVSSGRASCLREFVVVHELPCVSLSLSLCGSLLLVRIARSPFVRLLATQRFLVKREGVAALAEDPPDIASREVRKLRADAAGQVWYGHVQGLSGRQNRQTLLAIHLYDRLRAAERGE